MKTYNWQQNDWPDFTWSLSGSEDELFSFAEKMGRVTGKWQDRAGGRSTRYRVNL
jgi:hypothetical protein